MLAAAFVLASSLAIDVPYLPQTDQLCGGAAAAMVFRYWGDAHADADSFAPLIDRREGGIAGGVLLGAIRARGWRTERAGGSIEALGARIAERQPVIVLLPDRRDRYHYVVVVGTGPDGIVVHDPAWGPSRTIRAAHFERAWKATGFWSLVILPQPGGAGRILLDPPDAPTIDDGLERTHPGSVCDTQLERAIDRIRADGLDQADALLDDVRAACPESAGPLRELSGVRFAQRRWADASSLAREALRREPHDAYALDLLGSSLFMQHDDVGALRAWNQIGKPRVNRVRIDGLHRTRYQTVTDVMGIRPNMLLTADAFERARRRMRELPDQATARLAVRPEADGFATVDVVVVETAAMPDGVVDWAGVAVRSAAEREIDVSVPGVNGLGDMWSARWRWWSHRPGVGVGFAAPGARRLPGIWRVDGAWDSESYGAGGQSRTAESRTHGGLTISDWLSGSLRYSMTTGLDAWSGGSKAVSIGGSLERAAWDDRLSLSIDAAQWMPIAGPAFRSVGAGATARSSVDLRGWVTRGTAGIERVSDAAPLSLWPGAGEGLARAPLLRAHPLVNEGVIDTGGSSVFGRTLAFGGVEVQRWMERPAFVRVALAGFVDAAVASRRSTPAAVTQTDLGVGLRVKIPGVPGVLRADVAHGLRDGANALTAGWMF